MAKKTYIDYDDTLFGEYIRQIENPDSIGWDAVHRRWVSPPAGKGYDTNNRGMGIDIVRNDAARELTQGRPGAWLSEMEERQLRNDHIDYLRGVIHKKTPSVPELSTMSPRKEAEVMGVLYRGDGKKLWNPDTDLGRALRSKDENDFHKAVSEYYIKKGLPERTRNNDKFWQEHSAVTIPSAAQKDRSGNILRNTQNYINNTRSKMINSAYKTIMKSIQLPKIFDSGGQIERKSWDKLSMAEKAAIMKTAIEDGIYDLDTIRRGYNSFAEDKENTDSRYYSTMEKVAEENYKKWGFPTPEEALTHALNDNTYNYRGYYDKYPTAEANADTHWTDEFKTVYHPTFSDESIYSGNVSDYNPQGLIGGHWKGETFIPAPWQREHNYASGGSIHIKPSHRGRLTELKARTGKSEDELYNDGNPAHKKMVVFARNARKWKHADGGLLNTANTFGGGGKKKKSGALGNQAFQNYLNQALQEDNTFNTPGGIKFLTDIAYAESRHNPYAAHNSGASGMFQTMPGNTSKGAYGNPMQQFRDMFRLTKSNLNYLKKHLTKQDWDRAAELGIDEYGLLAGAHLGGVGGVVNALRGIKNAKDSNGTSVMSYMTRFSQNGKPALGNDITANPVVMGTTPETTFTPEQYQLIYGNNPYSPTASYAEEIPIWPNPYRETIVEEPTVQTIELSPIDFTQQNDNNQRRRNLDVLGYVLGSSKSNRRNGSLYNTIQMISDEDSFNPLRLLRVGDFGTPNSFAEGGNKKTAKQGNTYNSGSSSKGNHSQQMNQTNIFRRNGKYFYQESPDSEEITVTPVNTLFDDPALWTYTDNNGRLYTPRKAAPYTQGTITEKEDEGPLVEAAKNYLGELQYDINNGIPIGGKYTMPAIAASALLPLAGEAFAGTSIAGIPATTWADAALTAGFGAHGLNHLFNEDIDGYGDAAMTALEIAPLGRLAKPLYEGVVQPGMRLFNSPLTGNWTRIGNREYRLSPNSFGANGIPIESRGIAPQITADNAANIIPEQWNAAYKAAVESGNRPEALRLLEQAYLKSGIPRTDITVTPEGNAVGWYHGSEWGNHTIFDSSAMNATIGGTSAHGKVKGNFLTTDVPSAMRYAGSSRFSSANVPEYTSPQTFSEKVKSLFGVYKPRRLYPAERIGEYAPKPERMFDTKGKAPINHLDKTDNIVYPLYVNPGEDIMRLDFQGKPWSQSPVEFPNNFYLRRHIRDDVAKTYRDEIVPYKDYETAYKAWIEDPINIRHGSTSLDGMYFDDGTRSIEGFNSAPRYETVRLIEERVPSTTNGAVQTAAKEGKTSVLMRNVIDSNGGPDGVHYAIDDFVTLKPNQQKLADITYDDNGNLIPLSQRFNWSNSDTRYAFGGRKRKK